MKRGSKTLFAICATSLAMSLAASTNIHAAPLCGTHEQITSTLATKYDEKPMHRGLTPQGTMVEVFTSHNGTFTVVVTMPTGQSCLVSAGTHWQRIDTSSKGSDKGTSEDIERTF